MPRPKRSKVAPSAPPPHLRKASKASPTVESYSETGNEGTNDLDDTSDPDERLATTARRVKVRNGKGKSLEINMVSRDGLENEDAPASNLSRPIAGIPSEESLLRDLDLESSSPLLEVGRRDRSTTGVDNSILAIGNFKRRPRQNSILGRAASRARSSSVEDNLAKDNGLVRVGSKRDSTLGNGNVERHRRELSLTGRNAGRIRSSSIGLNMDIGTPAVGSAMKIGTFKRRAREPSILGTAQKKQRRVPYDEYQSEDDDFNPDDESTPLNLSKTRTMDNSSAPSSSNSRKRKLSAVQVPQSQPQRSSPFPPEDEPTEDPDLIPASVCSNTEVSDEEENEAEREMTLGSHAEGFHLASDDAHAVTPEPLSETMAPPQSSSSSPPSPIATFPVERLQTQRAPARGRRPLRSQTPLVFNQDSPPSSPPSLTHSPNRPTKTTAKQKTRNQPPPASSLSTAQLQALLPRRRRRARNEFDIDSSEDEVDVSGLASDDDELAHSTIRAPPRRSAPVSAARAKLKSIAKTKAGAKITYGSKRQAASDKENQEEIDPDDSLAPVRDDEGSSNPENGKELEKRVGKELKRAVKKFAEVDKWEMEFEDVTASSSSPKDAR